MKPISPILASISSTTLTEEEKNLLKKYNPSGFCFFKRNIESKSQIRELIEEIKETMERDDILFSIDQEGGRVRRLNEPDFQPYLPQSFFGKIYLENPEKATRLVKTHSYLISKDFIEIGANMNLAPVLDINTKNTTSAISSRCFSDDENIITHLSQVSINTYLENSIYPCMKHIPGHGKAAVDPHLNLPIINNSFKELEKDFTPFKQIKNCPFAITAHILIPEIDKYNPITQSKIAIDEIIRKQIGFDGILISDAIDMKALKGSLEEKAIKSLEAGCDIVCYASGNEKDLKSILKQAPLSTKLNQKLKGISKLLIDKETNIKNDDIVEYQEYSRKMEFYQDKYDATEVLNLMMQK